MKTQARSVARETVEETARQLAARAAGLSPVRTGRLKAGWLVADDPGQGTDKDEIEPETGGYVRYVVNDTPYALEVELGTLGRPGRYMAQQAVEQVAGQMRELFAAKLIRRAIIIEGDYLEPVHQSVEPEEVAGDPSDIGP